MSGFSFGTPSTTTSSISFGKPAVTVQTGSSSSFSFGATTSSTAFGSNVLGNGKPVSTGFSLGTQEGINSTGSTGFGFGLSQTNNNPATVTSAVATPITTAPPAFGSQQQTTAQVITSNPNPPTPVIGLAPISSVSSFGTTTTTTTQQSIAPLSFGLQTAAPSFGFSLPQSNVATTNASSTATLSSLFPNTTSAINVVSSSIAPSVSNFVGLGGIDMSTTLQKAPEGKIEAAKVKGTQVPVQIIQSVEEFKNYVKNQKTISSEITRSSDRKLKTVNEEIQRLYCVVQEISNDMDTKRSIIRNLKNETSKVIESADMAQRTHETPSGLQFENVLPQLYFRELIHRYEMDLLNLKHQVEETEKHLQSLANPQNFTAQDIKRGLQQMHECFIALAGRVQEAHTKVESQKEQYLQFRKFSLGDSTNVFETPALPCDLPTTKRIQYGPNLFSNQSGYSYPSLSKISHQQQQQQLSQLPALNLNQSASLFGNQPNFSFK